MPSQSPRSLGSGQSFSGESQTPEQQTRVASASQAELSSSSKPSKLCSIASIASAAALSLIALAGCDDKQNTDTPSTSAPSATAPASATATATTSTPATAPIPTPAKTTKPKKGPFDPNIEYCKNISLEIPNTETEMPARPAPHAIRTYAMPLDRYAAIKLWRMCSPPVQYGKNGKFKQTGFFEKEGDFYCDDEGTCSVPTNATFGEGKGKNNCFVLRRAHANTQYGDIVRNPTTKDFFHTLDKGHLLDEQNLRSLENMQLGLATLQTCPERKTPLKTTKQPGNRHKSIPVPVEENCTSCEQEEKQNADIAKLQGKVAILRKDMEDNKAVDARQDGDILSVANNVAIIKSTLDKLKFSDDGHVIGQWAQELANEK